MSGRGLPWADPSSRGVLPHVVCSFESSRNLEHEATLVRVGLLLQKKSNLIPKIIKPIRQICPCIPHKTLYREWNHSSTRWREVQIESFSVPLTDSSHQVNQSLTWLLNSFLFVHNCLISFIIIVVIINPHFFTIKRFHVKAHDI